MSKVATDDIDALIVQFRDIRTNIMRDNAHSIQARRQLEASIAYMDVTRSDPPSSGSSVPFTPTAPFVPSSQSEPSTQSPMPSFVPVHCPPLEQLGPTNWSKVLEVLAQAVASPGTNSSVVFHFQSAVLSLAAEPAFTASVLPTQPASPGDSPAPVPASKKTTIAEGLNQDSEMATSSSQPLPPASDSPVASLFPGPNSSPLPSELSPHPAPASPPATFPASVPISATLPASIPVPAFPLAPRAAQSSGDVSSHSRPKPNHVLDDFPAGALPAAAVAAAKQQQRLLQESQAAAVAACKAASRAKAKAGNTKSPSKRSTAPQAQTRGRKRVE